MCWACESFVLVVAQARRGRAGSGRRGKRRATRAATGKAHKWRPMPVQPSAVSICTAAHRCLRHRAKGPADALVPEGNLHSQVGGGCGEAAGVVPELVQEHASDKVMQPLPHPRQGPVAGVAAAMGRQQQLQRRRRRVGSCEGCASSSPAPPSSPAPCMPGTFRIGKHARHGAACTDIDGPPTRASPGVLAAHWIQHASTARHTTHGTVRMPGTARAPSRSFQ